MECGSYANAFRTRGFGVTRNRQARIETRSLREHAVMKTLFAVAAAVMLLSACAHGGADSDAGAGTGSITMYGTIDEGITFRK